MPPRRLNAGEMEITGVHQQRQTTFVEFPAQKRDLISSRRIARLSTDDQITNRLFVEFPAQKQDLVSSRHIARLSTDDQITNRLFDTML